MERIDELQRGGYRIIQDPEKFCFGTDAVILADYARAKPGEQVMDLCTGNGIVPVLMLARYPKAIYTALEIQPEMAAMARRSMKMNGIEDRIAVYQGDLRSIKPAGQGIKTMIVGEAAAARTTGGEPGSAPEFKPHSFHVVTVNPPYMKTANPQLLNDTPAVQIARHEVCCSLRDVMEAAAHLLMSRGRFYMVHRPQRLAEIFEEMQRVRIEPKGMQLVHPYIDKEPTQVLVEGVYQGGREMRIKPPLITYEAPGVYTRQMLEVYGQDGYHSFVQ